MSENEISNEILEISEIPNEVPTDETRPRRPTLSIDEMKEILKETLGEKRYAHTLAVCEEAVILAERFGADKDKAYLAALLHDCARWMTPKESKQYCKQNGVILGKYMGVSPKFAHAYIGASMARRQFGVRDGQIINAIRRHSTGHKDMSLLDKIIFVADAIEPGRTGQDVEKARIIAKNDLDTAVVLVMMTIKSSHLRGKPMHPNSKRMLVSLNVTPPENFYFRMKKGKRINPDKISKIGKTIGKLPEKRLLRV